MRIVLSGPLDTASLRTLTGLRLDRAPAGHGGQPVAQLAAALRARGHDVSIVTLDGGLDEPATIEEDGLTIVYCPARGAPRYRARTRMKDLFAVEIRALQAAIEGLRPDIVHAHWTYEHAEAAVRTRLPHLVTMHDLGWEVLGHFRDAYRAMRLMMKVRVMPRVQDLSVVSPFMAPKARAYGYFRRVRINPNGTKVPPIDWKTVERKACAPLRIATIGDAGPLKNVRASVAAHRIIRETQPDAELHLFGPGLDETFASHAGVTGHGAVANAELMRFLAQEATILVHPSRTETFGMIIAEAKMRAVPVVGGAQAGGVPYVCGENAGCALVDIERPDAIAAAVLGLAGSPEAYLDRARAAHADAVNRFDINRTADLYLAAYREILAKAELVTPSAAAMRSRS